MIGRFTEETKGLQKEEFVGLRAKLYSYKMCEDIKKREVKKCKGISKVVVKKSITHEDYKNCLFTEEEQMRNMNVIRSHLHEMYIESVRKIALSSADDKTAVLQGRISTYWMGTGVFETSFILN
jgi:hypothetical protein